MRETRMDKRNIRRGVRFERLSRRWTIAGLIVAVFMVGYVLAHRSYFFMSIDDWQNVFLATALISGVLSGIALAFRPGRANGNTSAEETPIFPYVWTAFVFFLAPLLNIVAVECLNGNFITELYGYGPIDNYIVALMLYFLLFALSGSVRFPVIFGSVFYLLFGVANMFVKEFKGEPLLPMDLRSIGTAMTVAGNYSYENSSAIIVAAALTILCICLAVHVRKVRRLRWTKWLRVIGLAVPVALYAFFYFSDVLVERGYKPDFFNEVRGYEHHGAALEFVLNTRYLWVSEPDGYDASEIADIVEAGSRDPQPILNASGASGSANGETRPNIIVIMNESFSDLRVLGDFETSEEMMPFIDSLRGEDNVIEGNAYTSVLGTGTSNTEYEFLTGDSMAFLPLGSNAYQIYIKEKQSGLASTLESLGYSTRAFHPYIGSNWNRESVYSLMGFDDYITMSTLFGDDLVDRYVNSGYSTTLLRLLLGSNGYDADDVLLRQYVSDAYDYQKVMEDYEERDASQPYFMFNVTMQNHSPYNFGQYEPDVHLEGMLGEYPLTEQYISIIRQSDEAFRELVEYYQDVDEPTIILMYGDHQPNIEKAFVEEVMGKQTDDMTDEELQKRYQTRFVLWANYDIPEGWIDAVSVNYLSTLLMQTAELPMTEYQKFLSELHQEVPVLTAAGCRTADGTFFDVDSASEISDELAEEIQNYRKVAYNNTFGGEETADEVFYLDEDE